MFRASLYCGPLIEEYDVLSVTNEGKIIYRQNGYIMNQYMECELHRWCLTFDEAKLYLSHKCREKIKEQTKIIDDYKEFLLQIDSMFQ